MFRNNSININYGKEKRCFVNKIKKLGLSRNGILFGGLVRDEIIASHYREEFIKKKLDFSQYWDKEYNPETNGRLIIPNDIDIYFKNEMNISEFIEDIRSYIQLFNGIMNINIINNSANLRSFSYNFNLNLNHTKVFLELKLGRTINFHGLRLNLEIDIISNVSGSAPFIEPPFYNLDFVSNIFIMEKNNGIINVRLSNCSGTPLDVMNFVDKSKISTKILDDIINFKTQFVRNIQSSYNTEFINCYRIIKMIDREYSWDITNVPFSSITIEEDDEDNNCCICLEKINKKQPLISINTNSKSKNILHRNCFISYLKVEQNKRYRNNNGFIEIRCPFRNPFNFKDCYKCVNYI